MKGTAARPAASIVSKRRAGTCAGQPAAVVPAAHGWMQCGAKRCSAGELTLPRQHRVAWSQVRCNETPR